MVRGMLILKLITHLNTKHTLQMMSLILLIKHMQRMPVNQAEQ